MSSGKSLSKDNSDVTQPFDPLDPLDPMEPDVVESADTDSRSGLIGLSLRLLGLVLGGGLALVGGMIFAIAYPQSQAEKPLFLQLWDEFTHSRESASDIPPSPSPVASPSPEQLQAEIAGLSQEWQSLRDRVVQLETRLAMTPSANQTLTQRLEALQAKAKTLPASPPSPPGIQPRNLPPLAGDQLKVTFPNEVLFTEQNQLSEEGKILLDTIIKDLSQYEGATIRIAAHLDLKDTPEANREFSFQLAETLKQYLASSLDGNYRWVALGYGQTRPLVPQKDPRNRRIEIAVD